MSSDLWLPEAGGKGEEVDKSSQKIQTSSYKISAWDMMYNMINKINTSIHYIWKLLRECILSSDHKEQYLFLFL